MTAFVTTSVIGLIRIKPGVTGAAEAPRLCPCCELLRCAVGVHEQCKACMYFMPPQTSRNLSSELCTAVCVLLLQTWRQQSWQYGAHDGVFVQVQALVPSPCKDDTAEDSDKSTRGSSDGSGSAKEGSKPSSTRSSGSSKVLSKTWFIRLRPDKPPS
jgi:hypothetical protein